MVRLEKMEPFVLCELQLRCLSVLHRALLPEGHEEAGLTVPMAAQP